MFKRMFLGIVILFVLFTLTYWYKSVHGIDISHKFSLSKYLPESIQEVIRPNIIFQDKMGDLIHEDFEDIKEISNWVEVPRRNLLSSLTINSLNKSRCLLVLNKNNLAWSLQDHHLIDVVEGQRIELRGLVRTIPKNPDVKLSLILFNNVYKVVGVYSAVPDQMLSDYWEHVSSSFMVPYGVSFLRLIIQGNGVGSFNFDEIKVSRSM